MQGFWDVPGGPRGPREFPKIDKNRFFPKKKAFRAWIFADVCTQYRFSSFLRDFSSIFHGKNDGQSMQKTMHLFSASLVFLSMATLTKHCILRYESYFFSFCVFAFFFSRKTSKNSSKIQPVFFTSKNAKQSSWGTRLGSQNRPELTSGGPKISKIMQKSRVLTVPCFSSFFKAQKVILGLAQITGVQQRSVLPAVSREGGSGSLVGWLAGWLVRWLAGWLVGCLAGWLVVWLVGWLAG